MVGLKFLAQKEHGDSGLTRPLSHQGSDLLAAFFPKLISV